MCSRSLGLGSGGVWGRGVCGLRAVPFASGGVCGAAVEGRALVLRVPAWRRVPCGAEALTAVARACRQLYDLSTGSPPVADVPVPVEGGAGPRIQGIVESIEQAAFTGKGDKPKVRPPPPRPAARCAGCVRALPAACGGYGRGRRCVARAKRGGDSAGAGLRHGGRGWWAAEGESAARGGAF